MSQCGYRPFVLNASAKNLARQENDAVCRAAALRDGPPRTHNLSHKRILTPIITQVTLLTCVREQAEEVFPMTNMTAEAKQKGDKVVRSIQSDRFTDLSGGLFQSISQLKRSLPNDEDGNPGGIPTAM